MHASLVPVIVNGNTCAATTMVAEEASELIRDSVRPIWDLKWQP